jgi:hypothetical protein
LHIRFQPGLEPLLLGQDSGEIKLRFNRSDWSEIRQSDDYSFTTGGGYVEWDKVALYRAGQRVWGSEPGSVPPGSATLGAVTVTASPSPNPLSTVTSSPGQSRLTATAEPSQESVLPNWTWLALVAVVAFVFGVLIALAWIMRKNR